MRYMIIKLFLLGLVFCVGKVTTLAQKSDIRCKVSGLDFNLSQADPGYFINFGSFSVFADGKEKEGGVYVAKSYKLPRIKIILSILVVYTPKGGEFVDQLMTIMVLSKKRIPFSSEFEFDKFFDIDTMTKNVINTVEALYSVKAFDGSEGIIISMPFLGKKKPIHIMMTCKKEGK